MIVLHEMRIHYIGIIYKGLDEINVARLKIETINF